MTDPESAWPNTVLVVDDEPSILALFGHALPPEGFEMISAPDAEQALDLADGHVLACLLVDKNLPGMDGLRLMDTMAQRQPHCACIVMTGYPSMASVIDALRGGAADYLMKPFDSLELVIEKIHHAIRRQRAVYGARVLGMRVQAIRQDLTDRDSRLAQMAEEIEQLSEALSEKTDEGGGATEFTPEEQARALEVTVNLARSLLTYTANLTSILGASPLTGDTSTYLEGFASAARRLDSHLDTIDFVRKKT